MQNDISYTEQFNADVIVLPHAPLGRRFLNYVIDAIVTFAAIFIVSMLLFIVSILTHAGIMDFITIDDTTSRLQQYLFIGILYVACFTIIEAATKGRTLGKLVTGTKAVQAAGSTITASHAFIRSICRLIPFEPISALLYQPWHDRISKTAVIVVKR